MLNEEPAQSQDLQMMGMLLPLGIEKGKDFKPDVATVARLNSAAAEAHAWLIRNNVPEGETFVLVKLSIIGFEVSVVTFCMKATPWSSVSHRSRKRRWC